MKKPAKKSVWKIAVLASILLIAIVVYSTRTSSIHFGLSWDRENWPEQFQSNGERIYFTGTSASGSLINTYGGNMHMRMHGGGCATCHGADRRGRRLMPSFWQVAPPLTPAALFDVHNEALTDTDNDHGHGDHKSYDDVTLALAITKGIDPSGESLDGYMPRWSMSDRDLADLVEFLKTPVHANRSSSQ